MSSSATITLFHQCAEETRRPASLVISVLAHGLVLGLLAYGIMDVTAIKDPLLTDRYVTRQLELHQPEPNMRRLIGTGENYPEGLRSPRYLPLLAARANTPGEQIPRLKTGPQTIVQPDIRSNLTLTRKILIAQVVNWKPSTSLTQKIMLPPPRKRTAADASPSLAPPTNEEHLAELDLSSSIANAHPQTILPSTTTPFTIRGPDLPQAVPVTSSLLKSDPVPAAVMTQSDLYMSQGTVTLPPVNQTAPAQPPALGENRRPDNGNAEESKGGGAQNGTKTSPEQASNLLSGSASGISIERITLPKNGQFSVMVVGSSLEEKYPEAAELWAGRLVYSVYLHVGLAKNWILQFSLPRSEDAKSAGNIARLEAPWPYIIVRPDLPPGAMNADALMIHGFVDDAGHFEGLAMVFPPDFPQGRYVLDALQQWQFRPAMQSGQSARVEVVLIIPDMPE